ncbi:MAG: preprotein translocase subunit SecG [Gammaproteobacteria bacterium]
MYQIIIVFHVLVGLAVIGLVLMQQGKGADAGAAFGSGASGTIFGARGSSSFLSRTTAIFAALFFATSLGLAVLGGNEVQSTDIMEAPAVESEVPLINNSNSEVPAAPSVSGQQAEQPQLPAGSAELPVTQTPPSVSTEQQTSPKE